MKDIKDIIDKNNLEILDYNDLNYICENEELLNLLKEKFRKNPNLMDKIKDFGISNNITRNIFKDTDLLILYLNTFPPQYLINHHFLEDYVIFNNNIFNLIDTYINNNKEEYIKKLIKSYEKSKTEICLADDIAYDEYQLNFIINNKLYELIPNFKLNRNNIDDKIEKFIINGINENKIKGQINGNNNITNYLKENDKMYLDVLDLDLCRFYDNKNQKDIDIFLYALNNNYIDLNKFSYDLIPDIIKDKYYIDIARAYLKQDISLNIRLYNKIKDIDKSIFYDIDIKNFNNIIYIYGDNIDKFRECLNKYDNTMYDFNDHKTQIDIDTFLFSTVNYIKDKKLYFKEIANKTYKSIILNTNNMYFEEFYYELFEKRISYLNDKQKENIRKLNRFFEQDLLYFYSKNFNYNKLIPLLDCDSIVIDKFIKIYRKNNIKYDEIKETTESFSQYLYKKTDNNINNLFSQICTELEDKTFDQNDYVTFFKILNLNDIDLRKELKKNSNFNDIELTNLYYENYGYFIYELFSKLQNNRDEYLPYIHILIDRQISIERKNFLDKNMKQVLKYLQITYDKKQLNDKFFNYLINKKELNNFFLKNIDEDKYNEIKDYLVGLENNNLDNINIKKNIGNIKKEFYKILDKDRNLPLSYNYLLNEDEFTKGLRIKNIEINDSLVSNALLYNENIFEKAEISNILELINDNEKYDKLINIINKYNINNWTNLYFFFFNKLNIISTDVVHNFINNFTIIYDYEELVSKDNKVDFKPINIVLDSIIGRISGSEYNVLLGTENYSVALKNLGPNSSSVNDRDRLDEIVNLQFKALEAKEVVIPSFIKEYEVKDKKINSLVAVKGDRRNLTSGERTGSCMRAGGVFESLYNATNTSIYAFNILFTDTDDNFISRVAGFRNGNTIFLNQLRDPVINKYTPDDLKNVLKQTCDDIINMTKNDRTPIENIVISSDLSYVFEDKISFTTKNIKNGVYNGSININGNNCVLVSTDENKKTEFKPYNDIDTYKICKTKEKTYYNDTNDIHIEVQRINAIKECFDNKNDYNYYKNISVDRNEMKKEYQVAIVGENYYVVKYMDGNIKYNSFLTDDNTKNKINNIVNSLKEKGIKYE